MTRLIHQNQSHRRRIAIGLAALGLLAICVAARADWRISYGLDPLEDLDDLQVSVSDGTLDRRLAFLALAAVGTWGLARPGPSTLRVRGALGGCLAALTAWCFASAAWSIDPSLTLRRLFTLGATIVFAVALAKHFSPRDVLRLACACAGLQLVLDIAVAAALGNFRPWEAGYRFAGLLHPNHEGVNCALLFFSSIAFARGASKARSMPDLAYAAPWRGNMHDPGREGPGPGEGRVAFLALAAFALLMLFLTKSRTALLATLVGYGYFRLQTLGRRVQVFAVSATICVGCAAFLLAGDIIADGLSSGATLNRTDYSDVSTLTGRLPLWEELLGDIAAKPLTGYGYGAFWSPNRIAAIFETQNWPASHAHCDYIELALALGLVGLFLYVSAIVLTLRSSRAAHRENDRAGHDGFSALIIVMSAMARAGMGVTAPDDEFTAAAGNTAGKARRSQANWNSSRLGG